MDIDIVSKPFVRDLYGVAGDVENGQYSQVGFHLMDAMWRVIGEYGLQHKGINHWVYESPTHMFIGVELAQEPVTTMPLLRKQVALSTYAYWKHIGPYSELGNVYKVIAQDFKKRGLQQGFPKVEIYGHWTDDESKLETEILISLASVAD